MFLVSLLLIAWSIIVFFIYRMIVRHELHAAEERALNLDESLENDQQLPNPNWHPYIRMF
jgi:hypothetical protein